MAARGGAASRRQARWSIEDMRMHRKLRTGGVEVHLHVFEAMPHGGFFGAPEDHELADEVGRFVASHLPGAFLRVMTDGA